MTVDAGAGAGWSEPGWVGREAGDARQARLAQLDRRVRDTQRQIDTFTEQLEHVAVQLKEALEHERKDYARELLSRRLNLRARLSDVGNRREALVAERRRLEGARQEGARQEGARLEPWPGEA